MDQFAHLPHPIIVLVRGLPGSGKSYLAGQLGHAIGDQNVVMLDPDTIDFDSPAYAQHIQQQIAEGVNEKLHAYRFSRAQAYQGIADHKVVIWNQPFTNLEVFQKMTARFDEQAAAVGTSAPILVVEVQIDPAAAQARVEQRKAAGGHGPSGGTFARFAREYTSFAPAGYHTLPVRGEGDATQTVAAIVTELEKLI